MTDTIMTDTIIKEICEFIINKNLYVYTKNLEEVLMSLNMLKNNREFELNEDYTTSSIHHDEFPDLYYTDDEWCTISEYIDYMTLYKINTRSK